MKKQLNLLLKYLQKFAGFKNKKQAANFLLIVFADTQFFDIKELNQKMILENLLSYFDTLIYNKDTKKVSRFADTNTIKKHIICKVNDLINYPDKLY